MLLYFLNLSKAFGSGTFPSCVIEISQRQRPHQEHTSRPENVEDNEEGEGGWQQEQQDCKH